MANYNVRDIINGLEACYDTLEQVQCDIEDYINRLSLDEQAEVEEEEELDMELYGDKV